MFCFAAFAIRHTCLNYVGRPRRRSPEGQMVPVTTSVAMPGVTVYAPVAASWV